MSKKKVLKVVLITIGCLVLLVIGLSSYIHRKVDQFVKAQISEALGDEYKADFRESHIGFTQKSITLNHLEISKQNDTLEFWNSHTTEIKIHGFNALQFLLGNGITIDSITVEKPEFNLLALDNDKTKTRPVPDRSKTESPTELAISVIRINNGSFKLDREGPELLAFDFNLKIKDISLIEILEKEQLDLLNLIDLTIDNFNYQFPDSVYTIQANFISALSNENAINATSIRVHSNLIGTAYPQYYGWQKVNFDFEVDTLSITRPTSIELDSLIIPQITVDGIRANLTKYKNYPMPNRHTELPQDGMSKMDLKFRCDSILIKNGDLLFEAIQETGGAAQIEVNDINGTLLKFQNIDSMLPAFTLIARAKIEEKASVELETVYSYGNLDPFTLKGSIGNTRLAFMDDFLTKTIGIKITEGILKKLDFDMYGNTYGVNGYVDFYYDDLVIHAVDKETGKDKKMVNFISNVMGGLVFWDENPSKDQYRRGHFSVERDVRKGFISQWIDGLLFGAMNTVSKVDANKMKKASSSIKDKFTKNKP